MNSSHCSEQAVELPTALVRIRQYDFREPATAVVMPDKGQYYFSMSLTSRRQETYASYAAAFGQAEYKLGRAFFVPTGLLLHTRFGTGRAGDLQCLFNAGALEQLPLAWDREQLLETLHVASPSLDAAAERIVAEMTAPGFASPIVIESLCTVMAIDLVRHFSSPRRHTPITGGLPGWRLRRIEERVNADGPPPTLSELAALCGMSPGHLRRAFRQQTGRSLSDRVTEVRTSRAADLLALDGLSLAEIGHRLGFAHLSAFSTAFRRATGESPSAFRARLRSERLWMKSSASGDDGS